MAKVINLCKPNKNPRLPSSYRPISLLCILGKIYEKLLLSRLKLHVSSHPIIPPEQLGFQAEVSTNHQLLRIANQITAGFNLSQYTAAVFLDLTHAFDTVWHSGLFLKLSQLDFPTYLLYQLNSFLNNRQFYVSWLSAESTPRPILAGVPQGSVLSPLLYSLYTSDFPRLPHDTGVYMFADDTALAVSSYSPTPAIQKLQTSTNIVTDYLAKWRLTVNPAKTQATVFTQRRTILYPQLYVNRVHIPWSQTSKYLGVTMDTHLNYSTHRDLVIQKANGKVGALRSLLISKDISLPNRTLIYTSIIRPTITYACPIWASPFPSYYKPLQILQNRVLRYLLGKPMDYPIFLLHSDLGIDMFHEHCAQLSRRFYANLPNSSHPLVLEQCHYFPEPLDAHRRPVSAMSLCHLLPPNRTQDYSEPAPGRGFSPPRKKRRA